MKKDEFLEMIKDAYRPNVYHLKKYLIEDNKKHPFVLILPGGGYFMTCSKVEGLPFAKKFNELGYHAFVLRYHVRNKARYPQPVKDVARAYQEIASLKDKCNIEMDNNILIGSSAGGHLASLYCTDKYGYANYGLPRPDKLILVYPVVTMGEYTHIGSKNNLLGKDASDELRADFSIENLITKNFPPTYIWCGTSDKTVKYQNELMLEKALKENGIPYKFEVYKGVGHGVGLALDTDAERWLTNSMEFLDNIKL